MTPSKRSRDAAERAQQAKVSAAVAEIADNRSGIEHAKAMLMLICLG